MSRTHWGVARLSLLLAATVLTTSCSTGRCRLTAKSIEAPVSFTPFVLAPDGEFVEAKGPALVKHFTIKRKYWTGWAGPREWDLSQEFERILAENEADAIVNLTVRAKDGPPWFSYVIGLYGLITPPLGRQAIIIEGDAARLPNVGKLVGQR